MQTGVELPDAISVASPAEDNLNSLPGALPERFSGDEK
jgi:hypothetical protein